MADTNEDPQPKLEELVQTDARIEDRDRGLRTLSAFLFPAALIVLGFAFGYFWGLLLKLPAFLNFLSTVAGGAVGVYGGGVIFLRSLITNEATIAFVTVDPFASLLGRNPLVCYGPGTHFAYFWEDRSKNNTVNLAEMAVEFKGVEVQCQDGAIKMDGSIRLRADITKLREFISGAAAVASDATGLIIAESVKLTANEKVMEVVKQIGGLNEKLRTEFQHGGKEQSKGVSDFEKRFGVIIGDVTIEKLMPAQEIQETMGVRAEMEIIYQVVAKKYGKEDMAGVEELVQSGELTREQVNRDVTQVMAASGNLQGMDLSDQNFNLNINGLDQLKPEVAQALGMGFAGAAQMFGKRGQQQRPNRKEKRNRPNQSKGGNE